MGVLRRPSPLIISGAGRRDTRTRRRDTRGRVGRCGRIRRMNGPTGEQLEITQSGARATVTTVGAGLRGYEVDGVSYTETFGADEEPPKGAGAVLVPWPNRVAGARWHHDGKPLDLEVTEPARGNAIHGLVRHETWTVTEHTRSRVSLEVTVDGRPGYPFPFRT